MRFCFYVAAGRFGLCLLLERLMLQANDIHTRNVKAPAAAIAQQSIASVTKQKTVSKFTMQYVKAILALEVIPHVWLLGSGLPPTPRPAVPPHNGASVLGDDRQLVHGAASQPDPAVCQSPTDRQPSGHRRRSRATQLEICPPWSATRGSRPGSCRAPPCSAGRCPRGTAAPLAGRAPRRSASAAPSP